MFYLAAVDVYNADAGRLDTAVTTGDTKGTAMALTATDILVVRVDPKSG
jgi:hypothetical protein